ncbi:MAG TPA: hypothetical protein VIU11_08420 [Nakamurella sp.]
MSPQTGDASPTKEEIAGAMPEPTFGIHVPDAPPCAQAASLAGMLLRITRQPTWPALAQAVAGGDENTLVRLAEFRLTDEQQKLLDEWAAVIEVAVVEPSGTVCVCSRCGDWSVIGSRSVPSACRTTSGCAGTVTKAPRATRAKLQASPAPNTASANNSSQLDAGMAAVIPLFGATTIETVNETGQVLAVDPDEHWTIASNEGFGFVGADRHADAETDEAGDFDT